MKKLSSCFVLIFASAFCAFAENEYWEISEKLKGGTLTDLVISDELFNQYNDTFIDSLIEQYKECTSVGGITFRCEISDRTIDFLKKFLAAKPDINEVFIAFSKVDTKDHIKEI